MNILQSDYFKNISKLSVSVLLSQVISVLLSPILTRLYSPQDFGVFSFYLSVVLIIEVCACLRYEMTIVLSEDDSKARSIFWLCTSIMSIATFLLLIILLLIFCVSFFYPSLNIEWNNLYFYMPISLFSISAVNIITLWCTRNKYFGLIAFIQSALVIFNNILSISVCLIVEPSGFYLIISQLLSYVLVMIISGYIIFRKDRKLLNFTSISIMRELFVEYKRMALYNTPASFVNIFSQRLPSYFFPSTYGMVSVGYYDLVYRILKLPSQIIGNSIRNVFFQKASDEYKQHGSFAAPLNNNIKVLLRLSVFPFCIVGSLSPYLFPIIFGADWGEASWYVLALLPWLIASFVVVPVSSAVSITALDKHFFKLQLYCLISRLFIIGIGVTFISSPIITVGLFSLIGCIFQLLTLKIIASSTELKLSKVVTTDILIYIILSLLISIIILYLVQYKLYPFILVSLIFSVITFLLYLKKYFYK